MTRKPRTHDDNNDFLATEEEAERLRMHPSPVPQQQRRLSPGELAAPAVLLQAEYPPDILPVYVAKLYGVSHTPGDTDSYPDPPPPPTDTASGLDPIVPLPPPTGTPAGLAGGMIANPPDLLTELEAIHDASMAISINGTVRQMIPQDLAGSNSLALIAALIGGGLGGNSVVRCAWSDDVARFGLATNAIGAAATIGYAEPPAEGTDISSIIRFTEATGATLAQGSDGVPARG